MNDNELNPRPVREARKLLGGHGRVSWRRLGGGNLNDTYLLGSEHSGLVIRARKPGRQVDVDAYLSALVAALGDDDSAIHFRYRTLSEEIALIEQLGAANIRSPFIKGRGDDWFAYTFVQGHPLASLLKSAPCLDQISEFLHTIAMANAAGIVCGDRWGGNEIVDQLGRVHLIDFDVEWFGSDPAFLKNLDVAVAVAGVLRNAVHPESCSHVQTALRAASRVCAYDLAVVARLLNGYADFYENREMMGRLSLASPAEVYRDIVIRLRWLAHALTG
jgi:hypothetical protein